MLLQASSTLLDEECPRTGCLHSGIWGVGLWCLSNVMPVEFTADGVPVVSLCSLLPATHSTMHPQRRCCRSICNRKGRLVVLRSLQLYRKPISTAAAALRSDCIFQSDVALICGPFQLSVICWPKSWPLLVGAVGTLSKYFLPDHSLTSDLCCGQLKLALNLFDSWILFYLFLLSLIN